MIQSSKRWLKFAALLLVPLLLCAVIAERASWRPRTLHYGDDVTAVAYSSDGRWLACATAALVELRDARTAQVVWHENLGEDALQALAFAPNSQTLALSRNNSLQLWDVPTHTLKHDLLAHYPYWHSATTLHFTPNSARLITGGANSAGLIWDTHNGLFIRAIKDAKLFVPLALSPSGRTLALLAVGHNNYCYVMLYDLVTGQKQCELRPPSGEAANCAAFMADHKTLAVGTVDGKAMFWDIATSQVTRQFVAHPGGISRLTFSPDGQLFATSGYAEDVKLWDAQQGTLLRALTPHQGSINDLSFAPDSATLAVACSHTVQLWRVE